ncbi:MAG: hypothetical protein RL701_3157 [Pseudomonadota bacterium]
MESRCHSQSSGTTSQVVRDHRCVSRQRVGRWRRRGHATGPRGVHGSRCQNHRGATVHAFDIGARVSARCWRSQARGHQGQAHRIFAGASARRAGAIPNYYVKDQGLTQDDARYIVDSIGAPTFPGDWSESIAFLQQMVDLLAEASGKPSFDAAKLFDRGFERVAAEVANEYASSGPARKAHEPQPPL